MDEASFNPAATAQWQELTTRAGALVAARIDELFERDGNRLGRFSLEAAGLRLDFSKNLVDDEAMAQLVALAEASPLVRRRAALFAGDAVNGSENRAALHTALRARESELTAAGLSDIAGEIAAQRQRVKTLSEAVRRGDWRGSTGEAITDVISIGIGGSDLGPKLVCRALAPAASGGPRVHFLANVDGEPVRSLLARLDPATTLVLVASKTFTTQETLRNADTVADWLSTKLKLANPYGSPHFVAITAHPDNALARGIPEPQTLRFWDWVGGRYSLWSAIGLPVAIALGFDVFEELLEGARRMDRHFLEADLRHNLPVVLGLLGVWYGNFLGAETQAVVPYCERLAYLPDYLQQLDMESNGKRVTVAGRPVAYQTGRILWGQTGTGAQHSFFQLLHQGTHRVPVDFVAPLKDPASLPEHHRLLLTNMAAQAAALMTGKSDDGVEPHRRYPGNKPSNLILMEALTPTTLGALIALYEHKVFAQSCVWNINPFDQWGVELGKNLTSRLLDGSMTQADPSTRDLMGRIQGDE